ncbi:MAG: hypothetical protein UV61_C0002G0177 [Candidatus Gottesmanbacteria bacterium GW2011_GWB1_43_11]|uniref:Phosphoesterase n=1 Tax=Candidatus Gottesmanbacteria bacterium GW2011_GWB1_43_11 TaxID=1618446 RepID=A0A0G1EWR8_9BACT|nr:MAG: hypothetical protein UV04_C0001G0065 [Candidatus Gottesmanbacteria bacterium GW2011_GWA2_42_16]KKS56254.1 MAG: hypothetical protein UV17_C0001G0064 [Candidatus Gottesmanbacteria bacterium GW2011_GWA1_42_26]KKS82587.1 MAG: hypothetical protein UV55_C0001G0047 [Candidatus Gottesmanbacteria bacterium GW2011_GWC1_43_10]KKS87456.1 MAG: hypothetical protein UV61_C0002G0177 [Candidatus Gottesmanbacteria bacterium GW2011_GWB1_43_11]OGG10169.1 MAG: hypothetical protein A2699_01320 [Candidatus Go
MPGDTGNNMKYALISDIHANPLALELVLRDITLHDIDKLLIAGDFVGYYYRPDVCFELLEEWNWIGVQGNHDQTLQDFVSGNSVMMQIYREEYGSGLDEAVKRLTLNQRKLLSSLPEKRELLIDEQKVLLCHGSPWSINERIYPDAKLEVFTRISSLEYDWVILGHTHYPLVQETNQTLIVNPGSVGQPRDIGGLASWMVVDFGKRTCQLKRVKFPTQKLIRETKLLDPKVPYLAEVLMRKPR